MAVLEVRGQILADKVIKQIYEEHLGLGAELNRRRRVTRCVSEEQLRGVVEQLEERLREAGQDVIDNGEEGVRTRRGTPVLEDRVCGLQHADVYRVVRRRQ